jgi:tetratricopeptide (TPR) repeat protein
MNKFMPIAVFIFVVVTLLSLRPFIDKKNNNLHTLRNGRVDDGLIIGCSPPLDPGAITPGMNGEYAPVFPGWGHYSYKISTGNDSAQFFFDQGLNMYYSYHLTEALASFKEAARQDSGCAMAYWGQALSMGPYYNSYVYKMPPDILPVLEKMDQAVAKGTEKEIDLAGAMNERYSADLSDAHRETLNRAYSNRLAILVKKYPSDPDIKALYVDAVMLEHAWNFWESDGTPKAWTEELVTDCDQILLGHPNHPAALHYEIHLVEASRHPEKALHNADVLRQMMPGVAHMVHMASHMYQRNGLYAEGVEVNREAEGLQVHYDSMARNLNIGTFFPLVHFNGVGTFCAMNANMYSAGVQFSTHLHTALSTNPSRLANTFFQYLYMMPMFANIRSGKWNAIMAGTAPDSVLHYATLLDAFGKGLALLHLHDTASSRICLNKLQSLLKDGSLTVRNAPFNDALDCALIANGILQGEISLSEKKFDVAIHFLEDAVSREDRLIYREPKDWPIPARHFLGACLLAYNKPDEAERVYRKDLVFNPGNGWAFLGLYQSLLQQHKTTEADKYKVKYEQAFSKAEELPPASVY